MFLSHSVSSWPDTSVIYSIPYLIMGLFVLVVGFDHLWNYDKKIPKWKIHFFFIYFLLFFGLRWHILSDTLAYEQEFASINSVFTWAYIENHSWWWDKGFLIFAMLVKLFTNDFFVFVFFNTLIDVSLLFLCIKRYNINLFVFLLAFLGFQGISTEINLMRNIKAILIFVYSISYIQNRQLLKFLACNILGFTFHSSALLFFPMYWLLNRKFSFRFLIPIFGIITVVYLTNINFLHDYLMSLVIPEDTAALYKISHYLEKAEKSTFSIGFVERLFTLIITLYAYKFIKKEEMFIIWANSFFVFYCLYAIFGFNKVFLDRVPFLFAYAYWFLYPYLFRFYTRKLEILGIIFIALFLGKIYLSTHIKPAYYETSLFHETTRLQRSNMLN